jgi:hypothetical protein
MTIIAKRGEQLLILALYIALSNPIQAQAPTSRKLLILALYIALSNPLGAQAPTSRTVTLVQVDHLPSDHVAMIYRPTGNGAQVIVLTARAEPGDLHEALSLLDVEQTPASAAPQRTGVVGLRAGRHSDPDRSRMALYRSFLRELDRSARRDVGGFRSVKAHDVRVPF